MGGVRVRGVVVALKGDWKWFRDCLQLSRWYSCRLMCHQCMATKGPPFPYADLGEQAGWLRTVGLLPYWSLAAPPALTLAPGFSEDTARWDVLHCYYLGLGRDAAGSAIAMLMARGTWPGTVPQQLQGAWNSFLGFCRRRGQLPTMTAFSRRLIL